MFFADAGPIGAFGFHSIKGDDVTVSKVDWDKMRQGMICESTDVFADLKSVIEKLCHDTGKCDVQTEKQADVFFSKVEIKTKSK